MNAFSYKTSRWVGNQPLREIAYSNMTVGLSDKEVNAKVLSALNLVFESTWSHHFMHDIENLATLVKTEEGIEVAHKLEHLSDNYFKAQTALLNLEMPTKQYPGHDAFCLLVLLESQANQEMTINAENACKKIAYLLSFIEKQLNANATTPKKFILEVCKNLSMSWKKLYPLTGT